MRYIHNVGIVTETKKLGYIGIAVAFAAAAALAMFNPVQAAKPMACTTIQDGVIEYSTGHFLAGEPLTLGYDDYGYNYQAHQFNGSYANIYLGRDGFGPYLGDDESYLNEYPGAENHWAWPYRDVNVIMKWNDAWLSNKDCGTDSSNPGDPDGKLDRHLGFDSYIGSGAWETNHQSGVEDGQKWNYFTKIVAAPADAEEDRGVWKDANGLEIGPVLWGEFATIQEVESGTGVTYRSPVGPGFGRF